MEGYIWWVVIGIALIIAALAGSAASYLNYSFGVQAVVAAAVATIGVFFCHTLSRVPRCAFQHRAGCRAKRSARFLGQRERPPRTRALPQCAM